MKFELSESRARKLVQAWEGHQQNDACREASVKCPVNAYFAGLKKKLDGGRG